MVSGSRNSPPIHDRITLETNRCLQITQVPERLTRENHIVPKGTKQRNCSEQLQTDNLPTDDVENINYLLTNCGLFPEEQKGVTKVPGVEQNYLT